MMTYEAILGVNDSYVMLYCGLVLTFNFMSEFNNDGLVKTSIQYFLDSRLRGNDGTRDFLRVHQ